MVKIILIAVTVALFGTSVFAQSEKKNEVIKKRFIHPKSKYLSISAGFGFTSILTKDPSNYLTQGLLFGNNTYVPEIRYEHGIKNNLFGETGIANIGQGIFHKVRLGDNEISIYNSLYKSNYIDLGLGYRLMNANNFHFANFHTGMFLGIANATKSNIPSGFGTLITDNENNNSTLVTTNIANFNPIAFGAYIGVSKEIRLSKDVRFFVKYIQRFGMLNTLTGSVDLSSQTIDYNAGQATFKVSGGGAFVTGGLKILLFKKKLRNG